MLHVLLIYNYTKMFALPRIVQDQMTTNIDKAYVQY